MKDNLLKTNLLKWIKYRIDLIVKFIMGGKNEIITRILKRIKLKGGKWIVIKIRLERIKAWKCHLRIK